MIIKENKMSWEQWIDDNMPEDLKKEMQNEIGEKFMTLDKKRKKANLLLLEIGSMIQEYGGESQGWAL